MGNEFRFQAVSPNHRGIWCLQAGQALGTCVSIPPQPPQGPLNPTMGEMSTGTDPGSSTGNDELSKLCRGVFLPVCPAANPAAAPQICWNTRHFHVLERSCRYYYNRDFLPAASPPFPQHTLRLKQAAISSPAQR